MITKHSATTGYTWKLAIDIGLVGERPRHDMSMNRRRRCTLYTCGRVLRLRSRSA